MPVQQYLFPDFPDAAYGVRCPLETFVNAHSMWPKALTPLVRAMILEFGADLDPLADLWGLSEEESFLENSEGRLALVGRTVADHPYVVETAEEKKVSRGSITLTDEQLTIMLLALNQFPKITESETDLQFRDAFHQAYRDIRYAGPTMDDDRAAAWLRAIHETFG